MADITHGTWIKDGKAVDAVYQNGVKVYGRNMLTGTSDKPSTITGTNWNMAIIGVYKTPKVGQEYTVSVEVPEADHDVVMEVYGYNNAGSRIGMSLFFTRIKPGEKCHLTFTWPNLGDMGVTQFAPDLVWTNVTDTGTYSYCKAKLEIGNTPTPWTPAPEDILK